MLQRFRTVPLALLTFASFLSISATPSHAGAFGDYFKGRQVGIGYATFGPATSISYTADRSGKLPEGCKSVSGDSTKMSCSEFLSNDALPTRALLWMEPKFQDTGWSHFSTGSEIALYYADTTLEHSSNASAPPIDSAEFNALGLQGFGYFDLGLTPPYFPDFMLKAGLSSHAGYANLRVEDTESAFPILTLMPHFAFDIVWWRSPNTSLSTRFASDTGMDLFFLDLQVEGYDDLTLNLSGIRFEVLRVTQAI